MSGKPQFTHDQLRLIDEALRHRRVEYGDGPDGQLVTRLASEEGETYFARYLGLAEREPTSTFSNAPTTGQPPWSSPHTASVAPPADPAPTFLASPHFGFDIIVDRNLGPGRLERERSRDGSCVNLSAVARNAKRLAETSRLYIDERLRRIYCAPHMKALLVREIAEAMR